MEFAKGHGTGNDFVLLPDPDGAVTLTPALVRALCDRRGGVGGDGVLRVVRTGKHPDAVAMADRAEWFMDYWNADGSVAEMCGNGSRVFARYLVSRGLARPGEWPLATRAGIRPVQLDGVGDVRVDMGAPQYLGTSRVSLAGRHLEGAAVSMGNPHLVCDVSATDLETAVFDRPPEFDPAVFPDGVNVELVTPVGQDHVRMRVHERGSRETASCGTGACAVAAVALRNSGRSTGEVVVDVPGGRLTVTVDARTSWLAGPAVVVGEGVLDDGWLAAVTG